MKIASFHDPVYNFTVHLLWDVNNDGLNEYLKTNFPDEEVPGGEDDWCGCHAPLRSQTEPPHEVHVVALQKLEMDPACLAVLTHEIVHVTHDVLHPRGLRCKPSTIEAYAYLHDSLMRRCLEAFLAHREG